MTRSGADGTLTALGGQKAKSVERRMKGERLGFRAVRRSRFVVPCFGERDGNAQAKSRQKIDRVTVPERIA
jgi:hypothetical protein